MSDPRIKLKINLVHDERNHDANVSKIEDKIKASLNHQTDRVEDVRIAAGRAAGAIFLTLSDRRFTIDYVSSNLQITSMIRRTVNLLEQYGYADNIRDGEIRLEAVSI